MNNYHQFSPIPRNGLPDYPDGDARWQPWLTEMEHYCTHGYDVGGEHITGRYFFHLNFGIVEGLDERKKRVPISPYHVDVMKEAFDLIDYSESRGENTFIWKARDKGFSYNMTSIALREMMFEKNAVALTLFPKGENVRHKPNFILKYNTTFNGLPECMKRYPRLSESKDLYHYGYKVYDEETKNEKTKGANNLISFQQVTNKDIAKSFRAGIIIIEEGGEIDCLKDLIMANEAVGVTGGERYGTTILGGTSNENNAGYEDVMLLWDNAKAFRFNKMFIPRSMALLGWIPQYDTPKYSDKQKIIGYKQAINYETGESLRDIANAHFERERQRIESTGDAVALLEHKQNYPENEDEAFLRLTTSPYPVEELNIQKRIIEVNEPLKAQIEVGNLELVPGKNGAPATVKFSACRDGRWKIYLHPKANLEYKDTIGIDTIKDEDIVDSDSKWAIVVYRQFQSMKELSGLPVCIYHHRSTSTTSLLWDSLLTSMYYDAMTLFEEIGIKKFSEFYIENGGAKYLAWRPTLLTELGSNAQNKWGVKPNSPVAMSASRRFSIEATRENYMNHVFPDLIKALIDTAGDKKPDLEAAYRWAILEGIEMIETKKKAEESRKRSIRKKPQRRLINKGGRLIVTKTEQEFNNYKIKIA